MFDYDKILKKLDKFEELSKKKQRKVFDTIILSEDFRNWFYNVGDAQKQQPMTKPMVDKIFDAMASPKILKRLNKYLEDLSADKYDQTTCSIVFVIIEDAIEISNSANNQITIAYKNGEIVSKEAKAYKEKSDIYAQIISEILDNLKERAKENVKEIARKSNLPKELIYTTCFLVPDRKYVQKHKISMYMNQILQEIYKWVGNNGIEDIQSIRWGSYFGKYFGNELTSSAAVSVLLEGVRRIDVYRDTEYFEDVRKVWDSLTSFALTELDKAPENVRRQMIEIYIKRVDKLYKDGNNPKLRVDLLNIPSDFSNLTNTLKRYSNRISKITKSSVKEIDEYVDKYLPVENTAIYKDIEDDKRSLRNVEEDDESEPEFNFEDDDDDDEKEEVVTKDNYMEFLNPKRLFTNLDDDDE